MRDEKSLQCDDCIFRATSKKPEADIYRNKHLFHHQLAVHMKLPPDYYMICDECDKRSLVVKKGHFWTHFFSSHFKWTKDDAQFVCDDCRFQTTSLYTFQQHTISKHLLGGEPTHICDKCGRGLKNRNNAINHLQRCQFTAKVKCPQCPAFYTVQSLEPHIRRKHKILNPFRFNCDDCDQKSVGVYALASHWMYVHGGIQNVCLKCGLVLQSKYSMGLHLTSKQCKKRRKSYGVTDR